MPGLILQCCAHVEHYRPPFGAKSSPRTCHLSCCAPLQLDVEKKETKKNIKALCDLPEGTSKVESGENCKYQRTCQPDTTLDSLAL